jgi:hypothetical protein
MDTASLVEGGAAGLERIVQLLDEAGIHIIGAYLIRVIGAGDFEEVNLRIATPDDGRDVLSKYVRLRRDKLLPRIAEEVTMTPVRPNNVEATRVLDYARSIGNPPVTIKGVVWKGLYIEDAVVVKYPEAERAVA